MSKRLNQWWQQIRLTVDKGLACAQVANCANGMLRSRTELDELEPRILFSATPIDMSAVTGDGEAGAMVAPLETAEETNQPDSEAATSQQAQSQSEIIIIDGAVPDLQKLLDDLSNSDRDGDVYVLEQNTDGVQQISDILESRDDVTSLHLISHAENGAVKLGSTWLSDENLDGYAGQIAMWQDSLTTDADILIYGCDLASSESGRSLVESIETLSGADVAASDDDTGHADYNGDWELEYATGVIDTQVAFSSELQDSWRGKLATITVTTFADEDNGTGLVSLREAISDASNGDTIDLTFLGAGTYTVTIDSLDIDKDLTITGIDAGSTVIDATGLGKRVFHLQSSSVVNMSGMTIQGGDENNGGGIFVDGTSTLNLSNALLQDNTSNMGGAIHVHGSAHLTNVLLYNNFATGTGEGGAIHFHGAGASSLTNVTISGNTADADGGGLWTDSSVTITNSTITLNVSSGFGGGIKNNGGVVNISNTIVAGNISSTAEKDVSGAFVSDGFNLIEVVNGGSGFSNDISGISANLGALANNGGQTDTHALLAGSAALNAGANNGAPATDQMGSNRDTMPDIGAFESALISTKIYWTEQGSNSIYRSNGDGTAVQQILSGLGSPAGLEIDLDGGKLYWIETATGSLHSSSLDGSGATAINTTDLVNPTGLGLDLVNGHIYVADDGDGADDAIRRLNLDGSGFTTLVGNLNGIIGDVAIDAVGGNAYFTIHNGGSFDGKIQSVSLGGGAVSDLKTFLTGPRSLVIDQPAGRLYYSDDGNAGFNFVVSIDLSDGGSPQTIASTGLEQPVGVAVDATTGKVYWGDATNNFIHRSNLDASGSESILTGLSGPQEIVVVSLGGVNVAPTVTSGGILSYTEGDGQVLLDTSISVADADGTLEGAAISITANHTPTEDVLLFTDQNGIVGDYVASTGVLTLTGSATVAQYEAALQSIKYENTSINPNSNTRTVTIQVHDGTSSANSTRMISVANVGALAVDTISDMNDGADTSSIAALMDDKGTDGKVSLREAIEAANNTFGVDTIHFQIDDPLVNGAHTILVGSGGLDAIIEGVIIDATTDDSYGTTPVIELNGTSAGTSGLIISGNNVTIRGLVINRFSGNGIEITGDNNNIENSYIGLNAAGDTDLGNTQLGIQINGGVGNVIGGSGAGNVISGNGFAGIAIIGGTANNNFIQGNLIGTDATGTVAIGNDDYGIDIWNGGPDNNTVGGATADLRNVISGNGWSGVHIGGSGATGNLIQGNYIGTDISGDNAIANLHDGVLINGGASGNTIDGNLISGNADDGIHIDGSTTSGNLIYNNSIGTNADVDGAIGNGSEGVFVSNASGTVIGTVGAGNVIGGNVSSGIKIAGSGATGTIVRGNFIGTDSTETHDFGNNANGIRVGNKDDDMNVIGDPNGGTIGGELVGQANVIANQTSVGVNVTAGSEITIQQNSIYDNGGDGIELTAANADRVAPMISTVSTDGVSSITITGTYVDASLGVDTLTIEYFSNAVNVQQGETFLGSDTFTTIAGGTGTISHTIAANVAVGEFITATVTDSAGNTSEFSIAVAAVAASTPVNVTARETIDSDANGQIDYIKITTDANLNDDFSGLTISVAGYALDLATPYVTNIGGGGANDNVFYVMLQEGGTPDTGATPIIDISANSSLDLLGGGGTLAIDSSGVAATDKAGAVLVQASSPEVLGTTIFQSNGHQLDFVFSESLGGLPSDADLEAALLFAAGASDADNLPSMGTGVDPFVLVTTSQTNDTIRVTLNSNNTISADGLLVGTHTVEVTDGANLTDAAGNAANNTAAAVIVGRLNEEPTLSATADDRTFTEDDVSPVSLFSGASASTIEVGQTFTALTLTITNVSDGSNEILGADGSSIAMIDGTGSFTATNGLSYSVSISSGTATIAFTGGTLSATELETIVNTLAYQNNSDNPNTSDRVVTLTSLKDSGGTSGGGDDTAEPGISSTITVDALNDAPTLSGGTYNLTGTDEDSTSTGMQVATILAGLTNSDVDGDILGLAITTASGNGTWQYSTNSTDGSDGNWTDFSAVASNSALQLSDTSWVRYQPDTVDGETASLTFHAWDGTTGIASVVGTPSMGDPAGGGGITAYSSATAQANLIISNVNDVPTVDNAIVDQGVTQGTAYSLQFTANTFGDVDGDTLTYTATLDDSSALPAWLTFNDATRTFSGTPANGDVGSVTIRVTADDSNGGTVFDEFVLTVTNTNDAPTVDNAISDQNATEDTSFSFQFAANTFGDLDGDTLTYVATLDDSSALPTWLTFDSASRTFSGTPANGDVGSITIRVTADDSNSGTVFEDFVLEIGNTNDAPTGISLDNTLVSENADGAVIGNVGVIDPDVGDTHTWSVSDSRFEIDGIQLKLKAGQTLDREAEPSVLLEITVTDQAGFGNEFTDSFVISVGNVNEAPVAVDDAFDASAGGVLNSVVSVLGNDRDPESDPTTVTLLQDTANGQLTFNPDGTFTYVPQSGFVGTDSFQYNVSDGSLSSNTATVVIEVRAFTSGRTVVSETDVTKKASEDESTTEDEDDEGENDDAALVGDSLPDGVDTHEGTSQQEPAVSTIDLIEPDVVVTGKATFKPASFVNLLMSLDSQSSDATDSQSQSQRGSTETRRGDRNRSSIQMSNADYVLLTSPGLMWNDLDQQRDFVESQIHGDLIVVGAAGAAASSFTVGLVSLALRTGFLASGLLAQMPAWKSLDPLLVMQGMGDSGDEESLQELMDRRIASLDDEPPVENA